MATTTPVRFGNHIALMCRIGSVTVATILATISDYSTEANAEKEFDIKFYAAQLTSKITTLQAGGWSEAAIKQQVLGILSSLLIGATTSG